MIGYGCPFGTSYELSSAICHDSGAADSAQCSLVVEKGCWWLEILTSRPDFHQHFTCFINFHDHLNNIPPLDTL